MILKTYEGFMNKFQSNDAIEKYLDDLLLVKYNKNGITKTQGDSYEILYNGINLEIYLNLKDEDIFFKDFIKIISGIVVPNKKFIGWMNQYIDRFYDDDLLNYYRENPELLNNIIIFDTNDFSNFIDILISKDVEVISFIDDRIKKSLNKKVLSKIEHLFNANNFNLI